MKARYTPRRSRAALLARQVCLETSRTISPLPRMLRQRSGRIEREAFGPVDSVGDGVDEFPARITEHVDRIVDRIANEDSRFRMIEAQRNRIIHRLCEGLRRGSLTGWKNEHARKPLI